MSTQQSVMTLADVKNKLGRNPAYKFEGIALYIAQILTEEVSVEDLVAQLSDEDLNEFELMNFFGPETEDFIVNLAIEQANFYLANEILRHPETSDYQKEELAYVFTVDYPLQPDGVGAELIVTLYQQGFLSEKEIAPLIPQVGQGTLLELAQIEYQNTGSIQLLKGLDVLNLSLFLQSPKINKISDELYDYLKSENKLTGKNAVAVLGKTHKNEAEQSFLIEQAILDRNEESAYAIFHHAEINDKFLKQKVIALAIKSSYFNFASLDMKHSVEVEEAIVQLNLYEQVETETQKQIKYQDHVIATLEKNTGSISHHPYLSPESKQIIHQQLQKQNVELPPVIKGFYNYQDKTFIPEDKSLNLKSLKYKLATPEDYATEGLKLWKPQVLVPAVLSKIGETVEYLLTPIPQEIKIDQWQAQDLRELHQKIKARIQQLTDSLSLSPLNKSRPFGVEIELCLKGVYPSDVALAIDGDDLYYQEEGARVNSTLKSAAKNWSIKQDASLRHVDDTGKVYSKEESLSADWFTAEIVTPKLYGEEGLLELKNKLNTLLSEYGQYLSVNITCGLHVHHDISELFKLSEGPSKDSGLSQEIQSWLENDLAQIQESVYSLCSPDRRQNHYCPRLLVKNGVHTPPLNYNVNEESVNTPRPGFNLSTGLGTIEFRMHEATLDVDQIVNWVRITHHLINNIVNKNLAARQQSQKQMRETLKLMEIEKLKKVQSQTDLETALLEINEFIKNNYWSGQFSQN